MILKKAKLMNINFRGLAYLPSKKKRFTVLRSPHVYKTSREQFELKIHSRVFIAYFDINNENDKKKSKLFINFIKNSAGGLQFKITYNTLYLNI